MPEEKVIDSTESSKTPKGFERSRKWPSVRNRFVRDHSFCAACGGKKKLEVHHKLPFHLCVLWERPELELEPKNLITLCEWKKSLNCHLIVGHGGNYQDFNPSVETDAEHIKELLSSWQIEDLKKAGRDEVQRIIARAIGK